MGQCSQVQKRFDPWTELANNTINEHDINKLMVSSNIMGFANAMKISRAFEAYVCKVTLNLANFTLHFWGVVGWGWH